MDTRIGDPKDTGDGGLPETSSDSSSPPDTLETGIPDAGGDAEGGLEAGKDAAPPTEAERCKAGAPRLSWDGAICEDHGTFGTCTWGTPCTCTFLPDELGKIRCLPLLKAKVQGYAVSSCNGTAGDTQGLVDSTTFDPLWIPGTVGRVASIQRADGRWEAHDVAILARPKKGGWYAIVAGACVRQDSIDYPYANTAGNTIDARSLISATAFYESTL